MNLAGLADKRLLVTGAGGYLGANLVARLRDMPCTIVRASRSRLAKVKAGQATIVDLSGDIREGSFWKRALADVDIVFHLAAQTSVAVAEKDPIGDWDVNVKPMMRMLEVCEERRWRPVIFFAGTVTEVGMPSTFPVDESFRDSPTTIYDFHKLAAETYLKNYCDRGLVSGAILRLPNVFGPGPASSSADRGILNLMVRRSLRGDALTVYGDGGFIRDYLYIDDAVEAFLAAALHCEAVNGRHFVLGTGKGHTVREAIECVAATSERITGKAVPVESINPPGDLLPIETRNFVANSTAFTESTGWRPRTGLPEGIERTLRWAQKQEET